MSPRTARGNRLGLAITGLALTLAGAAAFARGLDARPTLLGNAHAPITGRGTREFADAHAWFWIALATATAVVALLALRWLAVQTRTCAVRSVRLEPDPRRGATTLPARTLTAALQDELGDSPYLRRASATLTGTPTRPHLRLTVTLEPNADADAAKRRIKETLDRLRQAMETEHLPTVIHIRAGR